MKIIDVPYWEIHIYPTSQILRGTFGSKIRVLFRTTGRVSITPKTGQSAQIIDITGIAQPDELLTSS
jgi:hypothetical protein